MFLKPFSFSVLSHRKGGFISSSPAQTQKRVEKKMEFEKRKAATLSSLASSKTDKSPKGTVDTHIIPLINTINSHPSYFTTSSCSGRISILSQPKPASTPPANKKKARGGSWLFISHDLADPNSLLPILFPTESTISADGHVESETGSGTELVFRFEPLIIAVECRDIEAAQFLVSLAIKCGFRESGITSANNKRVIMGIRCSIRMEVPLGDSDRILVSEEYARFLVDIANQKIEANWKRTQGLLSGLRENGFVGCLVSDDGEHEDGHDDQLERTANGYSPIGMVGGVGEASDCSLSASPIVVAGEPVEKLFLWGHSACILDRGSYNSVLVFGGFGGMGRHARRNDCFLFDPFGDKLKAIDVEGAPSPRLGHTASLVGDFVFVIGGRADPSNILNDVWVLNTAKLEWKLASAAAAVVGSNIYVYGGLNSDTILSSLHVLNTENLQWLEVLVNGDGEQPCGRHSHSMVAYGSKVFMFGGYNGERALGDLYSFDVQTCMWKLEKTAGRSPHARFSHSMFVYKNFLGVIGGCPVGQHFQELALLDLQFLVWKHVTLDYIGKELLVRTTANVVVDDLFLIGGSAACYAFGTKFSEPLKVNLLPLVSLGDKLMPAEKNVNARVSHVGNLEALTQSPVLNSEAEKHQLVPSNFVLQLEKKYAKFGKDILKNFGWLDLGRKVYTQEDGLHICFPITEKFSAMFLEKQDLDGDVFEEGNDTCVSKPFTGGILLNVVSCSTALNFLKKCGATNLADEVGEVRKTSKSPFESMNESVALLIKQKDLAETLLEQLPNSTMGASWDIVVLPATSFKDPIWDSIGKELWPIVARSLNTRRIARRGRVASTGTRDSTLEILVGDNGWVDHRENGILYSFDATKCMFSWGNLSEKLRMGNLECKDEVIVDLFAGIGYFTLPFLVRAKAKLVYACEWNSHAVEALRHNLEANLVSGRCIVLQGDNRMTAPKHALVIGNEYAACVLVSIGRL
ncbi:unnamed protein product [Dovyalis caffra]|uniref:tRNA wybutosine-synthesizing protein 3 n=1 Tax=Dovyalis caffra TaxID=77055 RepID=A0AAV1SIF8_9ROSI|nr:unnamed protein product [Dovyalis caffra]